MLEKAFSAPLMASVISQVDRDEKRSIEKNNDVVLVESPLREIPEVLNDKAKIKKAGDGAVFSIFARLTQLLAMY